MHALSIFKLRGRTSAWVWAWVSLLVVALDQWSKWCIQRDLPYQHSLSFLPGVRLVHVHNMGAALNFLGQGALWQVATLITLEGIGIILIGYFLTQTSAKNKWSAIGLSLLLGGAFSNVIDRLLYQYVIDYIDFFVFSWHWPAVVNLADIAITVGVVLYLFSASSKEHLVNAAL